MSFRRVGMEHPPIPLGTEVPPYGRIMGMTVQRDDPGNGTTTMERMYFLQTGPLDVALLTDAVVRAALSVRAEPSE